LGRFLTPNKAVGVDTIKTFANGIPCVGCVPTAWDFQDPIIGIDYSPLHAVTNLLWNCDDALPAGTGSIFTDKNFANSTGCVAQDCDPYPLRVPLKRRLCPETVIPHSTRGTLYFNDEVALIKSGTLFETFTPVGQPPTGKGIAQEVSNTPVVVQVNLANPATPVSRHIHIVATDNSNRWVWWSDMMPFSTMSKPSVAMMNMWMPLMPATSASVLDGTVGTIQVKVGDLVSFYVSSPVVAHGLVLSDKGSNYATSSEAVQAFFSTLYTPASPMVTTPASGLFAGLYGHSGWASASPMYSGYLFAGVVRDNVVGTRMYFSDLVFGPYAMNGVLELTR